MQITAIATAYHPDERLRDVVGAALTACSGVIVVDNTPGSQPSAADDLAGLDRVRVVRNSRNGGLAAALNEGVRSLPADTAAVLLLDQDSVLAGEVVEGLAAHLAADPSIGVVAPQPWDAEHDRAFDAAAPQAGTADRDAVITSGMMIRRTVLEQVGPFRESFFVDQVDSDFCLRVRARGWRIVQDGGLRLPHSLGEVRQVGPPGAGVTISTHPVWRVYWYARNTTVLLREHRRDSPAWVRVTRRYLPLWFAARAVLEPPRRARIAAALAGFRDGRRGGADLRYLPGGAQYAGDQVIAS